MKVTAHIGQMAALRATGTCTIEATHDAYAEIRYATMEFCRRNFKSIVVRVSSATQPTPTADGKHIIVPIEVVPQN